MDPKFFRPKWSFVKSAPGGHQHDGPASQQANGECDDDEGDDGGLDNNHIN
jgi:hypothetical protein